MANDINVHTFGGAHANDTGKSYQDLAGESLEVGVNKTLKSDKENWYNLQSYYQHLADMEFAKGQTDLEYERSKAANQVQLLMAAGMSRQAALAALSGGSQQSAAATPQGSPSTNEAPGKIPEMLGIAQDMNNTVRSTISMGSAVNSLLGSGVDLQRGIQQYKLSQFSLENAAAMQRGGELNGLYQSALSSVSGNKDFPKNGSYTDMLNYFQNSEEAKKSPHVAQFANAFAGASPLEQNYAMRYMGEQQDQAQRQEAAKFSMMQAYWNSVLAGKQGDLFDAQTSYTKEETERIRQLAKQAGIETDLLEATKEGELQARLAEIKVRFMTASCYTDSGALQQHFKTMLQEDKEREAMALWVLSCREATEQYWVDHPRERQMYMYYCSPNVQSALHGMYQDLLNNSTTYEVGTNFTFGPVSVGGSDRSHPLLSYDDGHEPDGQHEHVESSDGGVSPYVPNKTADDAKLRLFEILLNVGAGQLPRYDMP